MYMHAPVMASAASRTFAGPKPDALKAVAVVEPLEGPEIAVGPGRLDAAVRVEQFRPDDSDPVVEVGGPLEALEPVLVRHDVVVHYDDVVAVTCAGDAAVHARREACVVLSKL